LAKRLGAHVTGVDNAAKQDLILSVGADDVIDVGRHDFTTPTQPYDLIPLACAVQIGPSEWPRDGDWEPA
jgi:hypothetical protein